MADHRRPIPRALRAPLGDATARVVNTGSTKSHKPTQTLDPQPNPLRSHPTNNTTHRNITSSANTTTRTNNARAHTAQHVQTVPEDVHEDIKRISTPSVVSSRRRKTHIGPWELGKTLGAGSAARVRLVRHNVTGQLAAVKILSRNTENLTQPGSIAELDKWDRSHKEYYSENRIPFTIEREVAIMKLIDHPNIVKLYDIWENRSEIYLVLEYVERGDFYGYLAENGPLCEADAMYFFRQLLSALDYVHSLNICHRDLKPENILITEDCQLKISDFGMSALHQGPNHMLRTSCGSPHYAAPELLGPGLYKGDKSDIWSLGIILYGCLCNVLPFNHANVPTLLGIVRTGVYHMPAWISPEARHLIQRMLTMDPDERISSEEIWQHPLVRKFDYLDNYNNKEKRPDYRRNGRYDPIPAEELDMQTLRQLKSVWHTYTEKQLATKLMTPEPNDFKLFYSLLCSYREKRLENYGTDLTYSPSDLHHLQPPNWKKKYTTREFPGQHGRTLSRFTVISNIATDENGEALKRTSTDRADTIRSYDPYKSSRVMDDVYASRAKIVIHRNGTTSTRASKAPSVRSGSTRTNSTYSRRTKSGRHGKAPAVLRGSRRSLNSIRSGEEISYKRPTSRHKRGVNFSYTHKRSVNRAEDSHRPASVIGDTSVQDRNFTHPTSPIGRIGLSKNSGRPRSGTQSVGDVSNVEDDGLCWNEELRHFSRSIAKDCDDAFNSTLLSPSRSFLNEAPFESSGLGLEDSGIFSAGINVSTRQPNVQGIRQASTNSESWDEESLPPAPPPKDSNMHESRKRVERVPGIAHEPPVQAEEVISQPHRPVQLRKLAERVEMERRVVSAPIYSLYSTQWGIDKIPLPCITETTKEENHYGDGDKVRVVSAPTESSTSRGPQANEGLDLEYLAKHRDTIRMVDSPSNQFNKDPVLAPAALGVRKESFLDSEPKPRTSHGLNLRQQYIADEMQTSTSKESTVQTGESSSSSVKKKSSWFKRNSKDKEDVPGGSSAGDLNRAKSNSSSGQPAPAKKKKSFNFGFWRGSKEQPQFKLSLGESEEEPPSPEPPRMFSHQSRPSYSKKSNDKVATRNIEPQQNWFARLFRVKPATRYLCFSVSRRRARKEINILLKEWRQHGMKDIVVDKERNLVFARVAKKNSLGLKEAAFAAEIMTVIEHGKRNQLCIVRFTQERGAASTFHKVIDTMDEIFSSRTMLVVNKHRIKMMIKTLNS